MTEALIFLAGYFAGISFVMLIDSFTILKSMKGDK